MWMQNVGLQLIWKSGGPRSFSHIGQRKLNGSCFVKLTVQELLLVGWMRKPAHTTSLLVYHGDGGTAGRTTDFTATRYVFPFVGGFLPDTSTTKSLGLSPFTLGQVM